LDIISHKLMHYSITRKVNKLGDNNQVIIHLGHPVFKKFNVQQRLIGSNLDLIRPKSVYDLHNNLCEINNTHTKLIVGIVGA